MTLILEDFTANTSIYPNIIYYNNNHSQTPACDINISNILKVTYTTPSTWHELITELEKGNEFLVFHADIISSSMYESPTEFVDAITTIARVLPDSRKLKIGVIVNPFTPLSLIRLLQHAHIQGLLLDLNYYKIEEVITSTNAFINSIPYWPAYIINQLSNTTNRLLNVYFHQDTCNKSFDITKFNNAVNMDIVFCTDLNELDDALSKNPHQLVFHINMLKRLDVTIPEIMLMIETRLKLAGLAIKVGVAVDPDTPVTTIKELKQAGVFGIVPCAASWNLEECVIGLHALRDKIQYWPKHIIDKLPGAPKKVVTNNITLTPRQQQIFTLITERGASNKVIAKTLKISESTVKLHITEIFKKYGVRNRTQLAVFSNNI